MAIVTPPSYDERAARPPIWPELRPSWYGRRDMSSRSSDGRENEGSRLGGARADFVASLGRKVNDARDVLAALEDDPSSKQARDELRRRLHALGAGARLLRFDAMSRSLQEVLGVLDRAAQLGSMREQEVAFVAQVVDDLPALAWGEAPPREAPGAAAEEPEEVPGAMPVSVLVVGGEALADALAEDTALRPRGFESERTEDAQTALELARAYAPDLMIVDADVPQAAELVEALLDDPLTEPVPILVVGTFRAPDEPARFVALGVARAMPKPVAADVLRRACDDVLDAREGRTMRVTLGEPTLEQLAERLSDELKRALVDSVDRTARSCRVPLGEGTEVLGALWGAIARVQEIVSQKTGGAVRFGGDAPEGTIALAPWLHQDVGAADRIGARGRGAAADVRLQGRRVVVADDDPGVTWFISDLLRTAGCEVHEALDGNTAREIAFRVQPELVVSDILMPGMDGFALSRALHRDVALRDVPVILLSWKEDLLQRVRELGASAAAYMKKESDSRSILARVREVLRPRARIEMRLRGDGEVRGRLDGLTARLLLELVGLVRRDARVAVRDATYLYEIEIRAGHPRKATRTAADGSYQSGERALASLLGVGAGRFVVSPSTDAIRGELTGTLADQLARPIANARGALAATTGAQTMNVERIGIDDDALEEYLRATPEPARALLRKLAGGASPRQMLLGGDVAPTLLEDVLADLAARGAFRAVEGAGGVDLLGPAVDAALAVLRGAPRPVASIPPNARPSVFPMAAAVRAKPRAPAPSTRPAEAPATASPRALSEPPAAAVAAPYETLVLREPPPPAAAPVEAEGPPSSLAEGPPSSLEDAVMREISDRSPKPGGVHVPASKPPPIVEPSALRKRSSNPPAVDDGWESADDLHPLPSIPPDAVVPAAATGEETAAAPPSTSVPKLLEAFAEPFASTEPSHDTDARAPYAELHTDPGPTRFPSTDTEPMVAFAPQTAAHAPAQAPSPAAPPAPAAVPSSPPRPEPTLPLPRPASVRPAPAPAPVATPAPEAPPDRSRAPEAAPAFPPAEAAAPKRSAWPFVLMFAVLGITIGVVFRVQGNDEREAAERANRATPSATVAPATPATGSVPPPARVTPTAAPTGDEIPPGAGVPEGYGLIEVSALAGVAIRVDGAIVGSGPSASVVAAPGYHEVRLEQDAASDRRVIQVKAGKTMRVASAPAP
jgi:DNA-binding response OmpR family regulator